MAQPKQDLVQTARAMVADGRGILAADESSSTMSKRLKSVGIPSDIETRRVYRQLLFTTPGLGEFISGAILFDETIRQAADDGTPFPTVLEKQGIMPGIKVDTGAKSLPGSSGEKVTEGLDWLGDRLPEYVSMGARFAKWRAVIQIGDGIPTTKCIHANAHAMARYAAHCQEAGLVPIVEPEVLVDGDHTIERCAEVSEVTLRHHFDELATQGVVLEAMVLKPNMVMPGTDCPQQASVEEVAETTVRTMQRVVPAAVPGIVFLSGGQDAYRATEHLNAMNRLGPHPWSLSFSYARALQGPTMNAWQGEPDNAAEAQKVLAHRARCNGAATTGDYTEDMEKEYAGT
ncbi:MAG TPA: class I fructose-bisphosphate aldolase [Egibacteraceae bacterium]|nr:class I fructose-bisphosphate aldolase [Egibacteraceae bacterium]